MNAVLATLFLIGTIGLLVIIWGVLAYYGVFDDLED